MISLDPPTNTQARIRVDDADALRLYSNSQSCSQSGQIQRSTNWKLLPSAEESWLDDTDAPVGVQRELMRHASIQTTMNVYGRAMTDGKRQAHRKLVQRSL